MTRILPFTLVVLCAAAFISHNVAAQSPSVDWSGLYIGGKAGGSWANFDFGNSTEVIQFAPPTTIPGFTQSDGSFLAGGQIGYNQQFGKLVFGFECDIDWAFHQVSKTQQTLTTAFLPPQPATLTTKHSAETDLMELVGPRLGFSWQRLLFYAHGGVAFAEVTARANDSLLSPPLLLPAAGSDSNTAVGWAAGGGLEWLITQAVSVGADYRHVDFGSDNYNPVTSRIGFTEDQVMLRVNVHLNGLFGR